MNYCEDSDDASGWKGLLGSSHKKRKYNFILNLSLI
jgi:hypothetical protein